MIEHIQKQELCDPMDEKEKNEQSTIVLNSVKLKVWGSCTRIFGLLLWIDIGRIAGRSLIDSKLSYVTSFWHLQWRRREVEYEGQKK